MSKRAYGITIAMFLVFVGSASYGQSPSCYDEMETPGRCLPWGFNDLRTELGSYVVVDLSKDGSAIGGIPLGSFGVARWRLDTGLQVFAPPPGLTNPFLYTSGPVLSASGAFVAGRGLMSGANRVFRWDVANNTSLILPIGTAEYSDQPPGTVRPRTDASISADGQTIVGIGSAFNASGVLLTNFWPFLWTNSGGTNADPGLDFEDTFLISAIDGLGSRVIGREQVGVTGVERAVFWTPGMGTPIAPFDQSRAQAISYDGQVIAGRRSDGGVERAFRWTQASEAVDIPHRFSPRTVSDDGSLITGFDMDTALPWTWNELNGYRSLTDYLVDFGIFFPAITGTSTPSAITSGDGSAFAVLGERWVANVSPLKAVALGDSYSSGEGAVNDDVDGYEDGTDVFLGNKCHRAFAAYPALIRPRTSTLTIREMEAVPGTQFVWKFIACSGAQVRHLLSEEFNGEPPQLQLAGEVDLETDLVTITIGGNDADFGPIVSHCVRVPDCVDDPAPFDDAAGQTLREYVPQVIENRVKDAVLAAYEQAVFNAPEATVLVLGYPRLVSEDTFECPATKFSLLGVTLFGGLSQKEQEWIREMADFLNERLKQSADVIGVHFEGVADRFDEDGGHNVCDDDPWIHGVVRGELVHSFHPSILGQQVHADIVNDFLSKPNPHGYFESGMPRNPPGR